MTPPERLEAALVAGSFTTKAEMARAAGVEPGTLRAYFSGRIAAPLDVCESIGRVSGLSGRWLFDGTGNKFSSKVANASEMGRARSIPIIDEVTAGNLVNPNSQLPERDWKNIVVSDLSPSEYFALKVVGTSMDRISPEGSIIIVDRNDRKLISGKPYVFLYRDETTYKLWHADDPSQLAPFSTDPLHRSRPITRKRELAVIGRVRRTMMDL